MYVNVRYLYIVAVSILPLFNHAQEWVAKYNGPGNDWDEANAIAIDNTGNVYVTGRSEGSGSSDDYATVKYDASGIEQWVARYNGPGSDYDLATAIALDATGNIYVTGYSASSGTYYDDYATVKYDASGVEQWVARYNGPGNDWDEANAIAIDNTGNVYVTGRSEGSGSSDDYATVKYDASGTEQWVARYNGPGNDYDLATAIALDATGNIYVTGYSVDSGAYYDDYATVKYDASGMEQWVARYNGPGNCWDEANAIAIDNTGNVIVTGQSLGLSSYYDYATVKYDASGVEQWVARYNGSDNLNDFAAAIALDAIGNIYVTGYSADSGSYYDYATVKYDASGIEQWVARYNGPGNDWDEANAIAIDNTGNVYVTGYSMNFGTFYHYDYATVKYDASGVEQWVARYNGPGNYNDWATAIALDNAGNIYVTGGSYGSDTASDYATIKYSSAGIEENTSIMKKENMIVTTIFRGSLQLPNDKKCRVFDIIGRIVTPTKITRGIYFIEVDGAVTQKVVKVR